uniref:Uncharacterized protein n=1 Tax=Tetranychus urticae TaxID=32264 RepID=T1JPR3_TETUR
MMIHYTKNNYTSERFKLQIYKNIASLLYYLNKITRKNDIFILCDISEDYQD